MGRAHRTATIFNSGRDENSGAKYTKTGKNYPENALVPCDNKVTEKRKVIDCDKKTYLDDRREDKTSLVEEG